MAGLWFDSALTRPGIVVPTEVVRTRSREIVLGKSLSVFMRTLGVDSSDGKAYTRLLNQMRRLFNAHVRLIYKVVRVQVALASDEIRETSGGTNTSEPNRPPW